MTRSQKILVGLLAAQLALIFAFRSPFAMGAPDTASVALLPGLDPQVARKIEILGADADKNVTLERDGDAWTVAGLDGFPADATKIDELLKKLDELQVRRPVVTSNRYHGSFNVTDDQNEGRLKVYGSDEDTPAADLILGSAPNYRTTHVRAGNDDRVWEVRGLSSWEVSPETGFWIRKDLLDVEEGDVTSISISNGSGRVELERVDGLWRLAGDGDSAAPIDQDAVASLVRNVAELRLVDGLAVKDAGELGLAPAAATVILRTDEPTAYTLEIGGQVKDKQTQRYVRVAGATFAGTAWSNALDPILTADAASVTAAP